MRTPLIRRVKLPNNSPYRLEEARETATTTFSDKPGQNSVYLRIVIRRFHIDCCLMKGRKDCNQQKHTVTRRKQGSWRHQMMPRLGQWRCHFHSINLSSSFLLLGSRSTHYFSRSVRQLACTNSKQSSVDDNQYNQEHYHQQLHYSSHPRQPLHSTTATAGKAIYRHHDHATRGEASSPPPCGEASSTHACLAATRPRPCQLHGRAPEEGRTWRQGCVGQVGR